MLACLICGAVAADEEAEQPVLTLGARNFVGQGGVALAGDEIQIAPTGTVTCALMFPTNQMHTFVVVARVEAASQLAVRLDTNMLATVTFAATNWTSHSFSAMVNAGEHQLVLAPADGATNGVAVASVTIIGGSVLPRMTTGAAATPAATTNPPVRPRWDEPVGR